MTPKTFVVPLDGSELAALALPVARELALRFDGGVLVMTVHGDDDPWVSEQALAAVVDELDVVAEALVVEGGNTAEEIAAAASAPDRMVCMTSHGRGGLRWAALGSVAEQVVRQSDKGVLLVGRHCRPDWPGDARELLLAVGDPVGTPVALDEACRWAQALELELRPVFVAHPLDTETREHPESVFEPIVQEAAARGVQAQGVVLSSTFVPGAIADLAARLPAALVVAATHARRGVARFALGSVAMGIVGNAPCPVLVTRVPE